MKKLFRSLARSILGLLLLYFASAGAWTLVAMPLNRTAGDSVLAGALCFTGGMLFFTFVSGLQPLYVFGHELTHWLAAKAFLRRTGRFRVGMTSGSVAVENPNLFIILAPYFVPFYTLAWIGLFGVYRFFRSGAPGGAETILLMCGIGLTYAHHLVLTVQVLRIEQADLKFHGPFLSMSFIFFCNVFLLLAGLTVATGEFRRAGALLQSRLSVQWQGVSAIARGGRHALRQVTNRI